MAFFRKYDGFVTLIETSTPGTYTIESPVDTIAEIAIVGAGGGGVGCAHGSKWYYADGGGGAAFVGTINISAGTYTVTVGAGGASNFNASSASDAGSVTGGSSSIGDLIIAGGGIRGSGTNCVYPGAGGTLTVNADVISSTIQSNGNNATGGGMNGHGQAQSLYQDYGKGGMGIYGGSVAGTNGYVKVRIKVDKSKTKAYNIMRRNREYFKYSTWNQPILTSNTSYGTITVSSDNSEPSEPWQILSSSSSAGKRFLFNGTGEQWIKWQLHEPIKISSCTVYNSSETSYLNRFPKSITLQVSDDGSVWKTIGSTSNYAQPGNKESISFVCDSDKAYSYIRWTFANTFGASPMAVGVIIINAKKITGGTSSDYDFYKDSFKAYNIINQSKEIITQRFDYTGALQTFTVPNDVTSIQVDCVGAKGYTASLEGGLGGRVKANLTVTPGQELKVWVGQAHSQITTPEYNASDIRTSSADITSEEGLLSRLIVAGGGGDGSQTNWGGGEGGHGGGLIGGSGRGGYGTVATGGTQTSGGEGGTHGAAYGGGSGKGNSGTFGLGGATKAYGAGSGGCGGAGWYGGGGGSMCTVNKVASVNGVGGAGGSSYTHPDLCSEVVHTQGYQSGDGYVKITYKRRRF